MVTAAVLFATSATVSSSPAAPAAAAAQSDPQGVVTVNATSEYSRGPNFEPSFSPPLPAGWTWSGSVNCTQVIVDAAVRRVTEFGFFNRLDVGDYPLRTCSLLDSFTVRDANGAIQAYTATSVLAGTWRVAKAPTELEVEVIDQGDGTILVSAVVYDISNEESTVLGAEVRWSYQTASGIYQLDHCRMTTEYIDPEEPRLGAIGQCELPAQQVLAGTGHWTAEFAGTNNWHPSATQGWLDGALTSPEQAALALANMDTVDIVADYQPPGCYIEPEPNASLIGISLSVVSQNCTALKILQVGSEILLTLLPGPGNVITGAVTKLIRGVARLRVLKWVKTIRTAIQNAKPPQWVTPPWPA